MILTEKTKNKSYCCKKPVYIEKIGDAEGNYSERPYCSGCLKFPEASPKRYTKNEIDADLKALEIYLKMGHTPTDAISAFEKVFANTKTDNKRIELIKKYISDFENANNK